MDEPTPNDLEANTHKEESPDAEPAETKLRKCHRKLTATKMPFIDTYLMAK